MCEEVETAIKVVVVGNGAVGKSSMIQRFCKGIFTRDYKKTIGVDFLERQIDVDLEDVRLMLWDTAGQEEFDAITKAYYRGAQAGVIAFSVTDRDSFDAVENWLKKVEDEVGKIPMLLVMNKIDLSGEALVQPYEAEELSERLGLQLFQTSVKDNVKVDSVFYELAQQYLTSLSEEDDTPMSSPVIANVPVASNGTSQTSGKKGTKRSSRPDSPDNPVLTLGSGKRRTHKKLSFSKCTLL